MVSFMMLGHTAPEWRDMINWGRKNGIINKTSVPSVRQDGNRHFDEISVAYTGLNFRELNRLGLRWSLAQFKATQQNGAN